MARSTREPERISIHASGITFGALAWGDADAPLALLVHGYPDTAWTWRYLGPFLAERGRRAVAPFTRGYAPTDLAPTNRYRVCDQRDDLLALHTALAGDETAVLIGHDWGAVATWAVTAEEPTRFARYVTIAIPPPITLLRPFGSPKTLRIGLRQLRMSWYFLYNQLPGSQRGLGRIIPKLWRSWSPGYDPQTDLAYVFRSLHDAPHRHAALSYYRNNLRRGLPAMLRIRPAAPVLYLHGEEDGCMQTALGELAQRTLPLGSRFERVPGVGHFMHLESPERINDSIADWIETPG